MRKAIAVLAVVMFAGVTTAFAQAPRRGRSMRRGPWSRHREEKVAKPADSKGRSAVLMELRRRRLAELGAMKAKGDSDTPTRHVGHRSGLQGRGRIRGSRMSRGRADHSDRRRVIGKRIKAWIEGLRRRHAEGARKGLTTRRGRSSSERRGPMMGRGRLGSEGRGISRGPQPRPTDRSKDLERVVKALESIEARLKALEKRLDAQERKPAPGRFGSGGPGRGRGLLGR